MLKPQMVRSLVPNLLSVVDYYVEQNAFKISPSFKEKELIDLVNIFTKYLLQIRRETGLLDENLISLSAIASPVIKSMSDKDLIVSI